MYEPFGPRFYEWWAGLTPLVKYGVAVLVLIAGAVLWYFDIGGPYVGGTLVVAAVILISLAGSFTDK